MKVQTKRVYDLPCNDDGFRVLADRLWPRGFKKIDARIDLWAKELAPTTSLRKWFNHDIQKFSEFRILYLEELACKHDIALGMLEQTSGQTITILFAARDHSCNHAVILRDFLSRV